MFHQASYQPQVVAALTQFSSLLNTARQGSAVAAYPKHTRTTTTVGSKSNKKQATGKRKKEKSFKQQQEELESSIANLAKSINASELPPTLRLSAPEDSKSQDWRTSYVSANSFFENKTGFPESLLSVTGPSIRGLYGSREFQELLTRCVQHSLPDYEQRRHFKSLQTHESHGIGEIRPKRVPFGIGSDFRKNDEFDEIDRQIGENKAKADGKLFKGQKYNWLHKQEPNLQHQILAFAEGYTGKKAQDTQKKFYTKYYPYIALAILTYVIWRNSRVPGQPGSRAGIGSLFQNLNFEVHPEEIMVTFNDVKGVDEAKQELQEIVEFLKDPEKFRSLGAKLPKGVLLVGSPGIGKTLLARAVAGEAGVPFFHASGSEFDELFVGSGSRKVRQLFAAAKQRAPSVVFLDEIDSVGAKRTSSQIHPYANQTINQLLSEMDGFAENEGVIVLGATNRKDNLDSALTRPGRFDLEVNVLPPDVKGRKEIFELYLNKVKTSPNIDYDKLAQGSRGMTGADIENIVNQAALKAARDRLEYVTMEALDFARDKVLMGPARKNKIDDEETNWCTAYHEAGHTLVAYFTKDSKPLHKVTILPRGQTLGHTSMMDEKEMYNQTKSNILAMMDVAMGGRAAEEVIYGMDKVTTGASSDFQGATRMATAMVKQLGMSDKIGCRFFGSQDVDAGFSIIKQEEISPQQQEVIDSEISRLLKESYERAKALIKKHEVEHKRLSKALMMYETLSKEEIANVINNKPIKRNGKPVYIS